jgi:hypothetical protein
MMHGLRILLSQRPALSPLYLVLAIIRTILVRPNA